MKKFYEDWEEDDINDYLSQNPVLVLFKVHYSTKEAEILIHGKLNDKQKLLLKVCILGEFGGKNMSEDLTVRINEYADTWYNDYIQTPKKVRVLNFGGKRK